MFSAISKIDWTSKWTWCVIGLIGLLVFYSKVNFWEDSKPAAPKKPASSETSDSDTSAAAKATTGQLSTATMGSIEVGDEAWSQPIVCLDSTKRIDVKMLTQEIYWEVRFDREENRVRHLYPESLGEGSHFEETKSFNTIEVRLEPGVPQAHKATAAWTISPKTGG